MLVLLQYINTLDEIITLALIAYGYKTDEYHLKIAHDFSYG